MPQNNTPTKVVTKLVRFSYVHVYEPSKIGDTGDEKYSVSLIIPKSDKETITKIEAAIEAAKEEGKTSKFGGKIPANLKTPLRDGDIEKADDPAYANSYFLNANSTTAPGIIDAAKKPVPEEEFYSGCYGRASINFFAFNTNGNKGIGCGLNHLQKIKDGEPLSGKGKAENDFDDDFVREYLDDDEDF